MELWCWTLSFEAEINVMTMGIMLFLWFGDGIFSQVGNFPWVEKIQRRIPGRAAPATPQGQRSLNGSRTGKDFELDGEPMALR